MAPDPPTHDAADQTGDGARTAGSAQSGSPLEALFASLRETLGDLAPDPLLERMQPVLAKFFDQFELVPRRDYDGHLAALERLEKTVMALEARIEELEREA